MHVVRENKLQMFTSEFHCRSCRVWKDLKGTPNVEFYQDNAEKTVFESESFDLIQYTYVLHEMPTANAEMVLNEAYRLLVPGGILSGFEGKYPVIW